MILDEISAKRKIQLEREKAAVPPDEMKKRAAAAKYPILSFKRAIAEKGLSVIAEVKKASPSKGLIQPDFDPVRIACEYEKAGAKAISCLTEEHYFQGSSKYLEDIRANVNIPILRKDFIFDEYQIYEAKAIGANAVLLIAALLTDGEFKPLYNIARSLELDVLCEAHDGEEVMRLANMGCEIIGVNNRDLKTFEVDIKNTQRLAGLIPKGTLLVCESGIKSNADMKSVQSWGADGALIGETLMRSGAEGIHECMRTLTEGVC